MNVLVTGANGQLGMELRRQAAGATDRFVFTDVTRISGLETVYLDITLPDAVELICESEQIDVIVNLAAYTNVDKAEDDPSGADLLNHQGPANLAKSAKKHGAALIHISTDYIFGGDISRPYKEDWPADPLGAYGATKYLGEQAIVNSGCRYIIIRSAWLFSPWGKNFLKTMLKLTSERSSLKVVFDQVGTPTSASDLAGFILKIISERRFKKSGTFHYSSEGVCSWYDFACAIRDISGSKCVIQPCHTSEFPAKARRPSYSVLDKTLVKETFGVSIPHWWDALRDCYSTMVKENLL